MRNYGADISRLGEKMRLLSGIYRLRVGRPDHRSPAGGIEPRNRCSHDGQRIRLLAEAGKDQSPTANSVLRDSFYQGDELSTC
jgi:hypothetical protein